MQPPPPQGAVIPPALQEPLLAVADTKFIPGRDDPSDQTPLMRCLPLRAALETQWPSDAHFVTYFAARLDGTPTNDAALPRINKACVSALRAVGGQLQHRLLVLDYDNHDAEGKKRPWTGDDLAQFYARLGNARDTWNVVQRAYAFYLTKNGARLLFLLDSPVSSEVYEAKIAGLLEGFGLLGIQFDSACSDWTRFFRAPFVVRDGIPSDPATVHLTILGHSISPDAITSRVPVKAPLLRIRAPGNRPSPDDIAGLLTERSVHGNATSSAIYKEAKSRLRGKACYDACFAHGKIADKDGGNRNSTLISYIGELVSAMFHVKGASAEVCYALLHGAVEQMIPDAGNPDWLGTAWDRICHFWGLEMSRAAESAVKEEQQKGQQLSRVQKIIQGMGAWCQEAKEIQDPTAALSFLKRRAIIGLGSMHYAIQDDGHYCPTPVPAQWLVAHLRERGLEDIIPCSKMGDNGSMIPKTSAEVINEHVMVASNAEMVPGLNGGQYRRNQDGTATMLFKAYCLNRLLEPAYDEEVHEWLYHLVGCHDGDFFDLIRWLSWAPAFDQGPTCALSLAGSPSAGKGMLMSGLSELLEVPHVAGGHELVSEFQATILKTPFINVNEGWSVSPSAAHSPATKFRELISGEPLTVNQKYLAPIKIQAYPRVILTANGTSVLSKLMESHNLTQHDRDALSMRIMHFDASQKASRFIESRGGYALTRNHPKGAWAGGTDYAKDFRVARHILALFQDRPPRDRRFQVEGNHKEEVLRMMASGSAATSAVIKTIMKMLDAPPPPSEGWHLHDDRVFVLTDAIVGYAATRMSQKINASHADEALKGLSRTSEETYRKLPGREEDGALRWQELDIATIYNAARQTSIPSVGLRSIYIAQVKRGFIVEK